MPYETLWSDHCLPLWFKLVSVFPCSLYNSHTGHFVPRKHQLIPHLGLLSLPFHLPGRPFPFHGSVSVSKVLTQSCLFACYWLCLFWGFPGDSDGKESTCNVGDLGSIPGLGRFPKRGHGNPFLYSCLEKPHRQRILVGIAHQTI